MRTTSTKLATDLVPVAGPAGWAPAPWWRLALDSAWRRKMDEVIVLSKASCGLTWDEDGSPAGRGVRVSSRLRARTERAYDELAAIEDAIARIDDGKYGICESCHQAMPDEWLADQPEVRYCPDCSLRRVSWQQPRLSICRS